MDITYSELTAALKQWLQSWHYCDSTIRHYEHEWNLFKQYLDEENLTEFSTATIKTYFLGRYDVEFNAPAKEHTRGMRQTMRALRSLLDYKEHNIVYRRVLTKDHSIPTGFEANATAFLEIAKNTLASTSYRQYRSHMEHFVSFLDSQGVSNFSGLTSDLIKSYWNTRSSLTKKTREYDGYFLRKLFDYLYENAIISEELSIFVPQVKGNRLGSIPSFFTTEELTKVLAMVDRANPVGKRDYALLLMAIRYGMRVGDIRTLQLSDIDWPNSKFAFIQSKTGKRQEFILLPEVSTALIDYFKNGRPKTDCKTIFIRHNAPYIEFGEENNLHNIISKYMKLAGITDYKQRKHGFHSLRHSLSGNMLDQGIPMPTISEVMGHSDTDTTMIYTKIGLKQLSSCALEVK